MHLVKYTDRRTTLMHALIAKLNILTRGYGVHNNFHTNLRLIKTSLNKI